MKLARLGVCLAILLNAAVAAAQDSVIYLVRHAERSDTPTQTMMGSDPPLSKAGHERAQRLASVLRSAGIKHIFTTEFQRTRQTAAPLAAALKIQPVMAPAKDVQTLVTELKQAKEPTLVVAHSNTLPEILKGLGVSQPVTIGEDEYDNLFVVVRHGSAPPTLVRLRFP